MQALLGGCNWFEETFAKKVEKDVPPQLELTVTNADGTGISDADVQLFESQADWEAKTGAVQTATTDAEGRVVFEKLQAIPYYFYVSKGNLSNLSGVAFTVEPLEVNVKIKVVTILK